MPLKILILWSLLAGGAESQPAEPEFTAEQQRFFETAVRPVLVEHCLKCHSDKKQWAGLRLDSRAALLVGGDSGAAVVPGKPDESLLIQAIRHLDDSLKMPKEGRLTDRQIADLTRWVEMGAPFPAAAGRAERSRDPNHWAFQPPQVPPVPAVRDAGWARTPVDRFILARLEAEGLTPAPEADRRTLIRRVTFDLTGLPPTPAEVEAFLSDESPDAWERLIDRLLDTAAYGEKWGRHWLDVARYADSNGLDENIAHGNAWRYRDWVVSALQRDVPFDRFVVEQLSGDLLPAADQAERHERLIATGFLSIGAKVLAEVDQSKMQMDIVDEQIDTVGRVFLGLTLGCARCHDHKFDPIATADYYGLAGVFKSTKTMDTYTKIARWHENDLESPAATALRAEHAATLAAKKQAVDAAFASATSDVRTRLAADGVPPDRIEALFSETAKADLKKLRDDLTAYEKAPPEFPAAMGVTEDKIVDVAIHVRGNTQKLGEVAPRRTPPVLRGAEPPRFTESESGRRQLAQWLVDPQHPLTARVLVNRVWRWHFGEGLVRTTDNFGLLGEAPSHPELLDWLARRFIADGWSLKSLHRLLLRSSAYRQLSAPSPDAAAKDPENRLLSRFPLRRLNAEEVRDALLAVSGTLDATMGGSLLKVRNREFLFDHTSKDMSDYTSWRRSIYLPIIRNNVYDLFQLLDFPDPAVPTGDRTATTVAPQALLMLNSEFVMQAAADLAGGLLAGPGDDESRLTRLYAIAYGREATAAERAADLAFLSQVERMATPSAAATSTGAAASSGPDSVTPPTASTSASPEERRRQAWNVLCHAVVAASEFLYVQ